MNMFEFLEDLTALKVEPRPWMKSGDYQFIRVTSESLPSVIDTCIESGLYALDLETTGLDNRVFDGETVCKIVGCCLSADGKRGHYIPLRHAAGMEHNIPWSLFKRELKRLVDSPARAIFHNAKFDQEFLQFCGGESLGEWDDPKRWEDTLILAYLRDTRAKQKGLKFLSKTELGMEMIELKDLFPEEKRKGGLDFSDLDPSWEPVIWYGASDAICTWNLYQKIHKVALDPIDGLGGQAFIYAVEKLCVAATRWMERARILTDPAKAQELIRLGQREWIAALEEVYRAASEILGRDVRPGYFRILKGEVQGAEALRFNTEQVSPAYMDRVDAARADALSRKLDPQGDKKGKAATVKLRVPSLTTKGMMEEVEFPVVYDVLSAQQLGALLRECRVPGLTATEKSGQVCTSSDEIERVLDEAGDQFPFAAKIKRFREIKTALSTFLLPILEDAAPDHSLRVDFNAFSVDTGRFSVSASSDPAQDGGTRLPLHGLPATYDNKRPECLLRIRECIISRPGKFLVAIDWSGVELRMVTNLSREPKWLREFFHCTGCDRMFPAGDGTATPPTPPPYCPDCGSDKIGDLHTLTGISIYGEDAPKKDDWKKKRGNAKITNFTLVYGGGGSAVVRAIGCDKNEGWRIKDVFDKTYKVLKLYWAEQHKLARKHKFVTTAFGRRYPVPDIDHEMGGIRSKAERNAVNGPIQGSSADLTKLCMGLIYKECKKRGWLDKVHMLITMHDELVFEIDGDILEDAIQMLVEIMNRNPALMMLKWPVPLASDVEIGFNWTVPWDLKKIRHENRCPPELEGCFKGVHAAPPVSETPSSTPTAGTSAPTPPARRVYRISRYTLEEVNALAALLTSGPGEKPGAQLRLEGPEGEDLTGLLAAAWGATLPMVASE
jgi:DNA polymerase I-like protein with 3'-5' exonuclease and polymerase domains